MRTYGGITRVLRQREPALAAIVGREYASSLVRQARLVRSVLADRMADRPHLGGWRPLLDFLRFEIAHLPTEHARVLYLDAGSRLIAVDRFHCGSVDRIQLHPRDIVASALRYGAVAVILAHNHPSGRLEPSDSDVRFTRQLLTAAAIFDIAVHDHVIVAGEAYLSLRASGLMNP